jgi:hypothetical protein
MRKLEFCQNFVHLKKKPISFAGRPYLRALYNSRARRLVVRASRQVEKTTFLANSIVHAAVCHPGIHVLFVCPRGEQASVFSNSRLLPIIQESPLIRRELLGRSKRKPPVTNLHFANSSKVYIRAAFHTGDPVRGIDADLLLVDEFQDIADGHLPVLEETLSHSAHRKVILTGTPKTVDNHLESVFRQSTAHEFKVLCTSCQGDTILDERCLGPKGPICPNCGRDIDPAKGRWVARNPTSTWGDGFWLNHLMASWINYDELFERFRNYDLAHFKNECLGLPTVLGEHVVSRAELEACCGNQPMARSLRDVPHAFRAQLVAGIDWGGGAASKTALVIGYLDQEYRFVVVRFDRFAAREDPKSVLQQVSERCRQFGIRVAAADGGGNGHVYNRLLLDRLLNQVGVFLAIMYSTTEHQPLQDGVLWRWTVSRSASIGVVFSRVKKKLMVFPRVEDCGSFLDEFAGEFAEYDSVQRSIRYSHPETQPDDSLHAANYALLAAVRAHGERLVYGL